MPVIRGGREPHRFETGGTFNHYLWTCSCGMSTDAIYPTLRAARDAVDDHVAEALPAPSVPAPRLADRLVQFDPVAGRVEDERLTAGADRCRVRHVDTALT